MNPVIYSPFCQSKPIELYTSYRGEGCNCKLKKTHSTLYGLFASYLNALCERLNVIQIVIHAKTGECLFFM